MNTEPNEMMVVDAKRHIEIYSEVVDEIVRGARQIKITDMQSAEMAVSYAAKAKSICKRIENTKKEITRQAREFTSEVNSFAKKFIEALETVEKIITDKIDVHKREEDQKREEEEALLNIVGTIPVAPYDDLTRIRAGNGSCLERTVWGYEVEEITDVPSKFLMVNDEAVKAAIKAGVRNIPGLKIDSEQKTYIRRG